MAHELTNTDQMMFNTKNGKPWHGLGNGHDGLATAEEMMTLANLNWKVNKRNVQVAGGKAIKGYSAIVRDDNNDVLSIMKSTYEPVQNVDALNFFDPIVDRGEAVYETAGSLRGGSKVWMLAKLPDYVRIGNTDDVIEKYVLLMNSHDGTSPVIAKVTPVRVVCNNTLSLALRGHGETIKLRHTSTVLDRLSASAEALGLVNKIYSQVNDIFNNMTRIQMNTEDMKSYFSMVLGNNYEYDKISTRSANNVSEVMELLETGAGVDMPHVRGTLWGAYNAVTEYVDHYKNYNKNTDKFEAVMIGSGSRTKEVALAQAVKLM